MLVDSGDTQLYSAEITREAAELNVLVGIVSTLYRSVSGRSGGDPMPEWYHMGVSVGHATPLLCSPSLYIPYISTVTIK